MIRPILILLVVAFGLGWSAHAQFGSGKAVRSAQAAHAAEIREMVRAAVRAAEIDAQELSRHVKESVDAAAVVADVRAGSVRLRVPAARCVPDATAAAGVDDGAAERVSTGRDAGSAGGGGGGSVEIAPATAGELAGIAQRADRDRSRLQALQAWVREFCSPAADR